MHVISYDDDDDDDDDDDPFSGLVGWWFEPI